MKALTILASGPRADLDMEPCLRRNFSVVTEGWEGGGGGGTQWNHGSFSFVFVTVVLWLAPNPHAPLSAAHCTPQT